MRPILVDLTGDRPRLLFPDGIAVEVPLSVALDEARRLVRTESSVNRVEDAVSPAAATTPLVWVADRHADGGAGITTGDCPSVRNNGGVS